MQCLVCEYIWSATPLSKKQTFKKHRATGCPSCNGGNRDRLKAEQRANTIALIESRGITILTEGFTGQLTNRDGTSVFVEVMYPECEHVHTLSAKNLRASISCAVCGKKQRASQLTQTSLDRSEEWQKTAPEWLAYKAKVTSHTTFTYNMYIDEINPHNHPRGIAGTEGAYHLDHIVPIRWCWEHDVPVHIAAHHTNLQMIPWLENVSEGGTLKQDTTLPTVLLEFVTNRDVSLER
jgi:ssDNA-binding Zn-finger/Zn-ribbon topoisomerase 1